MVIRKKKLKPPFTSRKMTQRLFPFSSAGSIQASSQDQEKQKLSKLYLGSLEIISPIPPIPLNLARLQSCQCSNLSRISRTFSWRVQTAGPSMSVSNLNMRSGHPKSSDSRTINSSGARSQSRRHFTLLQSPLQQTIDLLQHGPSLLHA